MPIPPPGWGAVEILLWDLHNELIAQGHTVHVVNVIDIDEALALIREFNADIVHLNAMAFGRILPHIECPVIFTCHNIDKDGFIANVLPYVTPQTTVIALNPATKSAFHMFPRVRCVPSGMNPELFRFSPTCAMPDRSICLGSLSARKRQHLFQHLPSIDFVGHYEGGPFPSGDDRNYKGPWDRETVHNRLTEYANLVFLSELEEQGIVICEAMFCGLGIVCSEAPALNLDTSLPWITVIPEDKITDSAYLDREIARNREIAIQHREEIREHGIKRFSIRSNVEALYFSQNNPETHA